MGQAVRTCYVCGIKKNLVEFDKDHTRPLGYSYRCKVCKKSYAQKWREGKGDSVKEYDFRNRLRIDYGISAYQYEVMVMCQGNVCAICGYPESVTKNGEVMRLAVDHDRNTGRVRGLLCVGCNTGLGSFNHDQERLSEAVRYLGV